ncbi:MAG: peptidylprolyl isomerase [Candidatus Eisenbacteria bacterium]
MPQFHHGRSAALAGLVLLCLFPAEPAKATHGAALPDSVLARIDGRDDVTRARFERAVRRMGTHPDSLTPHQRREFLDLLIDQRVLAQRAARERWQWSHRDSAEWLALRDHLTMTAVLDSALAETARRRRAAGQPELEPADLGAAARDSAMAWMQPRFHEPLVATFATAFAALPRRSSDMGIMEQIRISGISPRLAPADSAGVLAESRVGPYLGWQLLAAWAKLNPIQRPRIEGGENVRQLVENGLFERLLRANAERQGVELAPAFMEALRERAELVECTGLVQREVYGKLPADSLTLRRYFRAHIGQWDIPATARVLMLVFGERREADTWRVRLANPAEAESLVARDARSGGRLVGLVTAESDSAWFAELARRGAGVVVGPDSTAAGWRVARIQSLKLRRARTFDEARPLVQKAWLEQEGERRMRQYLDRLRRGARVQVNESALSRR